jgi:hypothetical protein
MAPAMADLLPNITWRQARKTGKTYTTPRMLRYRNSGTRSRAGSAAGGAAAALLPLPFPFPLLLLLPLLLLFRGLRCGSA